MSPWHPRFAGDHHGPVRGGGLVLSGMVRYSDLRDAGEHPNLATAFGLQWRSLGGDGDFDRALAGLTTVVMVLVLGQSRIIFAMARDGLLPNSLARTGSHGTPVRVTVMVAVLIAIAATAFPVSKLEEMVNVGTLFAFVLVSAGVVILRRTRPIWSGVSARPLCRCCRFSRSGVRLADAQSLGSDLDQIPGLDGARGRHLRGVRASELGSGAPGSGRMRTLQT